MSKTFEQRIATKDEKIQQFKNQKKQLIQKQKETERKERIHRFCQRHGLLEKYMPDLTIITFEQFEMFIRRAVDTTYGRDALAEIIAKARTTAANKQTESSKASTTDGGAKPLKAEQLWA